MTADGSGVLPDWVPPPVPPDDAPPPAARTRLQLVREGALALPRLGVLAWRLMRDERVPARRKAVVGMALLYAASPIDIIPEMLVPIVGRIDDVLLLALAVHLLLRGADDEVVAQYWDGDEDTLEIVTAIIDWASELVPWRVRRLLAG